MKQNKRQIFGNMQKVKALIITALIIILNTSVALAIEDMPVKKDGMLTLEDCVSIAINHSPNIKKYEYNLEVAKSNVGIARSNYFPTLGAGAGIYQDYNSNKNYDGSSNRELPSVDVYLSQLIWNFGKTSALIRMEKFYQLAAEYQFMDSICNTIYDVKTKYYNALKAQAIRDIEYNNTLICIKNYWRAKQFYESGKKPKIDFVNAEVCLTDAKMRLTDAQTAYDVAMADLANSLYIAFAPDFKIKKLKTFNFYDIYTPKVLYDKSKYTKEDKIPETLQDKNIKNKAYRKKIEKNTVSEIVTSELLELPFSMDKAFDLAYKNSPDLWVLDATLDAMKQSLLYIKREYYPDITGSVGYGFNNTRTLSNNNLNMAVNMTTAINFKQLKHEIDRANAQVNLAGNDIDLFKQNLYFEVKKCFLNVNKGEQQVINVQEKVEEALENYQLADERYDKLQNDYIALQQARNNYNEAKILYVNTLYDYNMSLANLEIAMHYHLDDLHHKAQHALQYHYREIFDKLESALHCEYIDKEEKEHNK